jgi:hypothetical protein
VTPKEMMMLNIGCFGVDSSWPMGRHLTNVRHNGGMITPGDHEIIGTRHENTDDINERASHSWIVGSHRRD